MILSPPLFSAAAVYLQIPICRIPIVGAAIGRPPNNLHANYWKQDVIALRQCNFVTKLPDEQCSPLRFIDS